jgi:hypothetical protein
VHYEPGNFIAGFFYQCMPDNEKFAAHVPKPIRKAITEYKIIFKESFLSSDIKIKRTIPNKNVMTLKNAIMPPIDTKNPSIIFYII